MAINLSEIESMSQEERDEWNCYFSGAIRDHSHANFQDGLDNGAQVNVQPKWKDTTGKQKIGNLPLVEAMLSRNVHAFDRLLALGANVNAVQGSGYHVFTFAVASGSYFVRTLLTKVPVQIPGLSIQDYINLTYNVETPLHTAVKKLSTYHVINQGKWNTDATRSDEIRKQYLNWFNEMPNAAMPKERHIIKYEGSTEPGGLIDILLKCGVDAEQADAFDVTPVMFLMNPAKYFGLFGCDKPSDPKYAEPQSRLEYLGLQSDGAHQIKLLLCSRSGDNVEWITLNWYPQRALKMIQTHIDAEHKKRQEKNVGIMVASVEVKQIAEKLLSENTTKLQQVEKMALDNKAKHDAAEALRLFNANKNKGKDQKSDEEFRLQSRIKKVGSDANLNIFFKALSQKFHFFLTAYGVLDTGIVKRDASTNADHLSTFLNGLSGYIPAPFNTPTQLLASLISYASDKHQANQRQDILQKLPLPTQIPAMVEYITLEIVEWLASTGNKLSMLDLKEIDELGKCALGVILSKLAEKLKDKETLESQLIKGVQSSAFFQERLLSTIAKHQAIVDQTTLKALELRIKLVCASPQQGKLFQMINKNLEEFRKNVAAGLDPKTNQNNLIANLDKQVGPYLPKGYTTKLTYLPFLHEGVTSMIKMQCFSPIFIQAMSLQLTELINRNHGAHLHKLQPNDIQRLSTELSGLAAGKLFFTLCNNPMLSGSEQIVTEISKDTLFQQILLWLEPNLKRSPTSSPNNKVPPISPKPILLSLPLPAMQVQVGPVAVPEKPRQRSTATAQ